MKKALILSLIYLNLLLLILSLAVLFYWGIGLNKYEESAE